MFLKSTKFFEVLNLIPRFIDKFLKLFNSFGIFSLQFQLLISFGLSIQLNHYIYSLILNLLPLNLPVPKQQRNKQKGRTREVIDGEKNSFVPERNIS
jgi:hypothetical protein